MPYKFINPYNFLPLGQECERPVGEENGNCTGYMECELQTLTPLIMLDTEKVENDKFENKHKVYNETFKVGEKPAIPGSELRGMIRSKFEALTSSCMSSVEEELEFSSRYKGEMNRAGLLDLTDPDKVKLYKCRKVVVDSYKGDNRFKKYQSGDKITFTEKTRYNKEGKKLFNKGFGDFSDEGTEGYLRKGEFCAGRRAIHIFVNTGEEVEANNTDELYKMFLVSKDNTNENLGHTHEALVPGASKLDKYSTKSSQEIMQPVWYEIVGGKVYLSIGQNGQVRYDKKLKDLIPKDFRPCKNKDNLCEACRVFGYVSKDDAICGKVRVSDGIMESKDDYYDEKVTLQELASPRYENIKFYMNITEDGTVVDTTTGYNWTTDFKSKFKGSKNGTEAFEANDSVMIRGRKEYWHHDPKQMNGYRTAKKTKRNITVKPVKDGVTYKFYVYFNNLTETQLQHLEMAISLGNESTYAHKIGHGKPLGYGSVKVKVNNIKRRELVKENGQYIYNIYDEAPSKEELFTAFPNLDEDTKESMKQMYDYDFIRESKTVDYPRQTKNGNIFKWFGENSKTVLPFSNQEYDKLILTSQNNS